jgi:Zn-dependent peptidase ImmA (M78 family)/transcriptional regulator with XRE-family HTH domain
VTVGERIAEARAERGLTQEQLAAVVGIGRSALAKVETGARRVSALELLAIARELGHRVEWFVDPGPPALASYRTSRPGIATQSIDARLDDLVRDVEFVFEHDPGMVVDQQQPMDRPTTAREADALAADVRARLGLSSDEPVHDLSTLVTSIGLLPFSLPLGEGADAGTVLLQSGGVSVVNGDLQVGRRRLALAHELGHYVIADEYSTDWRVAASDTEGLEARLDRFARALLLPDTDLRRRWTDWVATDDETLRDAAVRAGSHYRVDMATLARRLTELRLLTPHEADEVRRVRTRRADIVEKNLLVHHELAPVSLPRPYEQAVLRLYRQETVTVDRALGLLLGTFDEESLPDLPPVVEDEVWSVTS